MQLELFPDYVDNKIQNLETNIRLQWLFSSFFWPSDAQIQELVLTHEVLAQDVLRACENEFDRRCDEQRIN